MTTPRAPYFHFDEKVNDKRRKQPAKDGAPAEDASESLTRPSSSSSAGSSAPAFKKLPLDKFVNDTPNNKHTPRRAASGDGSGPLSSRHTPRRPSDGGNSGGKSNWKGSNSARSSNDGFAAHHYDHIPGDSRSNPSPDTLWEYMDSKGDVHGPYPADKILLWYDSKRFPGFDDSLILRPQGNASWSSMKAILPQIRLQVQNAEAAASPMSSSYVTPPPRAPLQHYTTPIPRVRFAVEDEGPVSDEGELSDLPPHIAQRLRGGQGSNFDDLPPHIAARLSAKAASQGSMDNNHYYADEHDGPPPGISNSRGTPSGASRLLSPESDLSSGPASRRRNGRAGSQQQGQQQQQQQQSGRNMDYRKLSDRELTMVAESLFLSEAGAKWYYMDPNNPRTSEPMNPQQMVDIITLRGLDPNFLIVGVSSAVTAPPSPAFYRPLGGLMQNSLRGEKYRVVTKADMMLDAPGLSWNVVRNMAESGGTPEPAVQDNGFKGDRRRSSDDHEQQQQQGRKERKKGDKQNNDSWMGSPTHSGHNAGPATSERSSTASFAPVPNYASPSTNTSTGGRAAQRTQPKGSPFAGISDAPSPSPEPASAPQPDPEPEPVEAGVSLDMDDILDAHITGQLSASLSVSRMLSRQSSSAGAVLGDSANPSPSIRAKDPKAAVFAMGQLQSWASQVSDELSRGPSMSMDASSSLIRDSPLLQSKAESSTPTTAATAPDSVLQQPQITPRTVSDTPKLQPQTLPEESPMTEPHSMERGTSPMRKVAIAIERSAGTPVSSLASKLEDAAISSTTATIATDTTTSTTTREVDTKTPVLIPSQSPVKPSSAEAATDAATVRDDDDASTSAQVQERKVSSSGAPTPEAAVPENPTAATTETESQPEAEPQEPVQPQEATPAKPGVPPLLRSSIGSLPSSAKPCDTTSPFPNKPVFKSLDLKDLCKTRSLNSSGQSSPVGPASNGTTSTGGITQAALARAAMASALKAQSASNTPRPPVKADAAGEGKPERSGRVSGLAAFFMQQMQQQS